MTDQSTTNNDATFPGPLIEAFRRSPDEPAFEYAGGSITRGELLGTIAACVRGLRAAGLSPGRAVAIATGVTPEGFAVLIAAYLLGLRVTGLRPGMPDTHLAHVLADDVHAVVLDATADWSPIRTAAEGLPVLSLEADLVGAAGERSERDLVACGRSRDTALVTLTSGSTGLPKSCAFDYATLSLNWAWQPARWTTETRQLAEGYRRFLLFGTLASAVVFEHLGVCLMGGGTAVIPSEGFDFPQVFQRLRISACLLTVPRLHHILDVLRDQDVDCGSLRVLLVAGSPLAAHRLAEATERIGPVVHQGYGQTETGMLTLLTPREIADHDGVLDSVGRAWSHVRIEIRDADGNPVPAGTVGEVWVRTAGALTEYRGDPAQTAEILSDGWVFTRDVGSLDADGFLRLTGRARDIIIVNAIVHYAGAIEKALTDHPEVDEAHVLGAADERTGEAIHAFVVPVAGRTPDPEALRGQVAAALGQGSVPATITLLREVPMAASGKPDRRALLSSLPAATT